MMRAFLFFLAVPVFAACTAGNATRSVRTDERIPVYSCVDTRIKQARECRPWRGVAHPSVLVQGGGNGPAISGPK